MSTRILIVDDEVAITEVLSMVMQAEGFDVNTAANGREGLDELARNEYDVVLLDLMMPVLDGVEMLDRLRTTDQRNQNTPVVLMSAGSPDVTKIKARYSAYLPKPFNLVELLATVRNVTAREAGRPDS